MERRRDLALNGLLASLLVVLIGLSLSIGPAHLSPAEMWRGLTTGRGPSGLIMREIRLPRAALAAEVGFILGLSGACLQGLLRNPLAEPAVFGSPQCAALGAVITLYFGLAKGSSYALPVAAIAGAALSSGFIALLAARGAKALTLLLAGLAVGILAGAGIALAINLSPNPYAAADIVFWLMGSFEDRSLRDLALATPFILAACMMLLMTGRGLRALSLGDEVAQTLGVSLPLLRLLVVAGTAVGVGAGVSVSGAIGFVGLAAPHAMRSLVRSDPRRILLPAAFAGSILLVAADIGVRLIPSTIEIKVGVATALIGGPLFIWLAFSRRAEAEVLV